MKLVEENNLNDYIGSVVMLYNVYRRYEGFTEELFENALREATREPDTNDFFHVLIQEITKGIHTSFLKS